MPFGSFNPWDFTVEKLLPILGAGAGFIAGAEQRELGEERRANPPEAQRGGVGVRGGVIPEGGFDVVDIPELFAFMKENADEFGADAFNSRITTLDQMNDIVESFNIAGRFEEAEQIRSKFNELLGSTGPESIISPGVTELTEQNIADVDELQRIEDEKFEQRTTALEAMREINDRFFPDIREGLRADTESALRSSVAAETASLASLNSGRIAALRQLGESRSMRAQVLSSFENRSAQEFEALSSGLDFRHRNNMDDLRNRLANDPAFAGRPEAIESAVREELFQQRMEIGGIAADISAKQERNRSQLGADMARMVSSSGIAAAGQFGNMAVQESNIRNQFSSRRMGVQMNAAAADMSLKMLEREGRMQEADAMSSLVRGYIPRASILREAMGINIAAEQVERANQFAGDQQAIVGMQMMGGTFQDASSFFLEQQAIDEARAARREAERSQNLSTGIQIAGIVAAPFTGGLSLVAAGAATTTMTGPTPVPGVPGAVTAGGSLVR